MQAQELGFTHRYLPGSGSETTLLLLHGTGGNEDDLLPLAPMLAPQANVLSPRGKVLERGMPRFFRRLAEGVFDLDDLRVRTHELADFVENAAQVYGFEAGKVAAAGFSNGANIAASVLLSRPSALAGAVLFHAMVPFEPETLPDLAGVPVFLSAGRADPIVPVENTERLATLLREAGAEVTLHWVEGGHSLTREEVVAAQRWLAERRFA